MIWTIAWNAVQADWNGIIEGGANGGVVRPQVDTMRLDHLGSNMSCFGNRQTWLIIIIGACHQCRFFSLDSAAGVKLLGFWNSLPRAHYCQSLETRWQIFCDGALVPPILYIGVVIQCCIWVIIYLIYLVGWVLLIGLSCTYGWFGAALIFLGQLHGYLF